MRQQSLGMGGHESQHSQKDEWLTPPGLLRVLGSFDLDPCAPIKRPWPTADRHYTIEDDGLQQRWAGRVWCNPPYGKHVGKWLKRCAEHGDALALIFARTETRVWEEWVWGSANSVLFLFGRIRFHHVSGDRSGTAGAPSALVAYDQANTQILDSAGLKGRLVVL